MALKNHHNRSLSTVAGFGTALLVVLCALVPDASTTRNCSFTGGFSYNCYSCCDDGYPSSDGEPNFCEAYALDDGCHQPLNMSMWLCCDDQSTCDHVVQAPGSSVCNYHVPPSILSSVPVYVAGVVIIVFALSLVITTAWWIRRSNAASLS